MKIVWSLVFVTLVSCVTTPETGKRALILTSESDEVAMGNSAYSEVLKKEKISNNAKWNVILQRVGERIARAANKPDYQWEFRLIESPEANAFCLPGGKVAVYTGILKVVQNEAGLATVIGHEVAHATARHGGQRMTLALGTEIGLMAASQVIGGEDSPQKQLLLKALGVGANVGAVLPFSRANESEADEIGLVYMARAGYDPNEAPRFWDRFSKVSGSVPLEFLSTHPKSSQRKQALENQLPRALEIYSHSSKHGLGGSF
jgi:metalloendopeptidase OMA1, mitochondrial